ncbi:dethiobiotin synthase [Aliiglaciecola sp. CAU 1673]|uniref:dethiobiotin synthase n=1 Tax=Aliiglaciecola sp. CAU 1673 TaxID=3032595 RepID=UPI0023D99D0C|nr:dethiobiotin synthase [Aliiglaciecola sp. CAU 1673]MDF2179918.1 dethiobiotin synthase [Aliiglaciecola sp. CAU 1673]
MKKWFITGTDTDVGKTFVSVAILKQLNARRLQAFGLKPIASGCEMTKQGLRNADALALQAASGLKLDYAMHNPIAFADPVAPHLAAKAKGQAIELDDINLHYQNLCQQPLDILLTEGAGGWRLPLGQGQYLSDFAKAQNMQVMMVVGMRLGCLNHAMLTAEAIKHDGLKLIGWVANQVELDMPLLNENIASLKEQLDAPFLGHIPRLKAPDEAQRYLDLSPLL